MIFVTVGTDTHPFDRLLVEIDDLVENNKIKERIVAQIGNSNYLPRNYDYKRFFSGKEMMVLMKNAGIIISHAGAGSIITSFELKKSLIIVPRLERFNEHTDNHQLELANELKRQKRAIVVSDIKSLGRAIKVARTSKISKQKPYKLIKILNKIFEEWENENSIRT